MADEYAVASGFSLSGGTLGTIAVSKFSGLHMDVEVSSNAAGNQTAGKRVLEPRPGSTKPGQPKFVCPIPEGNKELATWWENFNPNAKQGKYKTEDLVFTFAGSDGDVHAQWQLKGVFPMSYQVSDANSSGSELASETIQLCVTEIVREK